MAAISKIISYGYRQTKALSVEATKEVIGVAKIPADMRLGYQCGKRLSGINKAGTGKTVKTIGTGVLRKGVVDHLPGILAGVGTIIPWLGTSAMGLVLGKVMRKSLRRILI